MGTDTKVDIYEVLDHPIRRLILETLHNEKACSFTELMKETEENTGSLSFHLAKLEALLKQDKAKMYSLNQSGVNAYAILRQIKNLDTLQSKASADSANSHVGLLEGEKVVISSDRVRPLGRDHIIPGLTKSIVHHVNATLTNRRLLLSGWRFFPPTEIELARVKLVRVKRDTPLTKGDSKGRSVEIIYADHSDNVHSIRFVPPDVERWKDEIREACSEV